MTQKELLNHIRIVGDIIGDRVYLAIVKDKRENLQSDDIVEVKESRELSNEEIVRTIFRLSQSYLNLHKEDGHTFSNGKVDITISMKEAEISMSMKETETK